MAADVEFTAPSVFTTLGGVHHCARRLLSHVLFQNDPPPDHGDDVRDDSTFRLPRARFRGELSRFSRHDLLHVAIHHHDRFVGGLPAVDHARRSRSDAGTRRLNVAKCNHIILHACLYSIVGINGGSCVYQM